MTAGRGEAGLEGLREHLHPEVIADVARWTGRHPLAPLRSRLSARNDPKARLDAAAEALVGHALLEAGCTIGFEVPTPNGRTCDFEARRDGARVFLHVKRFDPDRPPRALSVSPRLRYLERIERPFVVRVRWRPRIDDEEMQRLVVEAEAFLRTAHVGDELVVRDEDGREIGGVLVAAPWAGPRVSLAIGLPGGFIDESGRLRRLLRRAAGQFMPRAENVVLVGTTRREDLDDLRSALFGSPEERWDAFPRRGERIAFGRAEDGFWSGRRQHESRAVGWFGVDASAPVPAVRMFLRAGAPAGAGLRLAMGALGAEVEADAGGEDRGSGAPGVVGERPGVPEGWESGEGDEGGA